MARYRVHNVEIDLDTQEVVGDSGALVSLEPRAFALLSYLIENRDRVVAKDELLAEVWMGRVVTDGVLRQAVAKARRVFGDRAESTIKTVPRVGYRLVGQVEKVGIASPGTPTYRAWVAVIGDEPPRLEGHDPVSVTHMPQGATLIETTTATAALSLALDVQRATPKRHVGIHAAEVEADADEDEPYTIATELAAIAGLGQVLLTGLAFELARGTTADLHSTNLAWVAHGEYLLPALEQRVRLFEVGDPSTASLQPPDDSDRVRRAGDDDAILGWRAAPDQPVPGRPHWQLVRPLGEGGFGEAWLAEHRKTREQRVFKFCFQARPAAFAAA